METKDFDVFKKEMVWFSGIITEPRLQYFESGKIKCNFSIPFKKNKEDNAIFLNAIIWGKMSEEFVNNYKKGDFVTIGGIFKEREYNEKKYLDFEVLIYN